MLLRLLIIAVCLPLAVFAQLRQDTSKRVNYLAIPILFRTPETGWAYGLSASASFRTSHKHDTATRMSVIQVLGIFSQREQNIQGVDATIYFPREKYILYFNSGHSYFPDQFWGIGQHTRNEDMEKYTFEQFNISPHLKRKFFKHTFFGVMADYQNVIRVRYKEDGKFDSIPFPGKSPYQLTGLGLTASYDTRNSTFWPTRGVFLQTQFIGFARGVASDYSYQKWMIEARLFKRVFKKHIIACQLYNYSTFGDTPFRSMASLGGSGNLRGFYQGRFRDKSMYSAIVEYRAEIIWRLSACVFGGIGDVYDKPKNINAGTMRYSFGGGIRFAILEKEKLNLRIDYGYYDKYNQGFYFTVGECF